MDKKRWNKRHPQERSKIVRNTFAKLQRRLEKAENMEATEGDFDTFYDKAHILETRLRFDSNARKHKLGRLVEKMDGLYEE